MNKYLPGQGWRLQSFTTLSQPGQDPPFSSITSLFLVLNIFPPPQVLSHCEKTLHFPHTQFSENNLKSSLVKLSLYDDKALPKISYAIAPTEVRIRANRTFYWNLGFFVAALWLYLEKFCFKILQILDNFLLKMIIVHPQSVPWHSNQEWHSKYLLRYGIFNKA